MSAKTYPDNFIEHIAGDPNDPKHGRLLALGELLPGGPSIDGIRIAPDEVLARSLAAAKAKIKQPIIWQGPVCWRTQHGQSLVGWQCGKPLRAWNVLLDDGRRATALKISHGPLWRRTADGPPKKYQWGKLEITADNVVFHDLDAPRSEPPAFDDKPNLERDLATDPAFVSALADAGFALAFVAEMNQIDYVRLDSGFGGNRYMGRDGAAHLVADLRGLGEELRDFQYWDQTITFAKSA